MPNEPTTPELLARWNHLYKDHLPTLAQSKVTSQPRWPVTLDHCFARIILDNAIGQDRPWTERLPAPAYRHMSATQLRDAIALAERIAAGHADLVDLNDRSLRLRGKKLSSGKRKSSSSSAATDALPAKKPRRSDPTVSSYFLPAANFHRDTPSIATPTATAIPSSPPHPPPAAAAAASTTTTTATKDPPTPSSSSSPLLHRIHTSTTLSPFRQKVLSLLCQIPRGQHTTYGALAQHISATTTTGPTSARAVGAAVRGNPYAPEVPCHRVLAADGTLGGFKGGGWGATGKFAGDDEKRLRVLCISKLQSMSTAMDAVI
jgi:methylated-DNA-[protein]-cysteine S-methyltransferase